MANTFYAATGLTGGGDSLDGEDGTNLVNGDVAIVATSSGFYHYTLNASSGAAENSPYIITPDTNAGAKRWILRDVVDNNSYLKHSLATAVNDFLVASGAGTYVKKTLTETKAILGLGSAAYTASTDYAVAGKGVTNGDSHDHNGGDGAQISHTTLSNIGSNSHSTIDTHLGAASPHSGHPAVSGTPATGDGLVYNGSLWVPAGNRGRKNLIINGCMRVNQRVSVPMGASVAYGPDRWMHSAYGSGLAGNIVTETTGSSTSGSMWWANNLGWTSGSLRVYYKVESRDAALLAGKSATFSVKVYQNFGSTQNFTLQVYTPDVADTYGTLTSLWSTSGLSVTNATWTKISTTGSVGSGSVRGLLLGIAQESTNTISNKNVGLCDAQLEEGSVATPFECRLYAEELAMCQRYYEKSYSLATALAALSETGMTAGAIYNSSYLAGKQFATRKRAVPTMVTYNPITGSTASARDYSANQNRTVTGFITLGESGFQNVDITGSSNGYVVGVHWTADAEL